jgi:hypothetical protein
VARITIHYICLFAVMLLAVSTLTFMNNACKTSLEVTLLPALLSRALLCISLVFLRLSPTEVAAPYCGLELTKGRCESGLLSSRQRGRYTT